MLPQCAQRLSSFRLTEAACPGNPPRRSAAATRATSMPARSNPCRSDRHDVDRSPGPVTGSSLQRSRQSRRRNASSLPSSYWTWTKSSSLRSWSGGDGLAEFGLKDNASPAGLRVLRAARVTRRRRVFGVEVRRGDPDERGERPVGVPFPVEVLVHACLLWCPAVQRWASGRAGGWGNRDAISYPFRCLLWLMAKKIVGPSKGGTGWAMGSGTSGWRPSAIAARHARRLSIAVCGLPATGPVAIIRCIALCLVRDGDPYRVSSGCPGQDGVPRAVRTSGCAAPRAKAVAKASGSVIRVDRVAQMWFRSLGP